MTMAKALTNGAQPMGAVVARQSIYDTITDAGPSAASSFFTATRIRRIRPRAPRAWRCWTSSPRSA